MDSVKINVNSKKDGVVELDISSIVEKNNELEIKLNDDFCYFLNEGDVLQFNRVINGEDRTLYFTDYVSIKSEDLNHVLHTTLPRRHRVDLSDRFYEVNRKDGQRRYIITCKEPHYLFGQDLSVDAQQIVYFFDDYGNNLGYCSGIHPLNLYRLDDLTIDDCIVKIDKEATCGKSYDKIETRHYNFSPRNASKNSFVLDDFSEELFWNAKYIETEFNPFYYYKTKKYNNNTEEHGNGQDEEQNYNSTTNLKRGASNNSSDSYEVDDYGNKVRYCYFYGDSWFGGFHDTTEVRYVNDGPSINTMFYDMDYYSVGIGVSNDANESTLGCEDYFSEQFAKNIEYSLIPDIIDMERVKYVPYGNNGLPLTSITIYPHFRERELVDLENNTNTMSTSGNLYCDGWYIDEDNEGKKYWNGYIGNDSGNIDTFVSYSGTTSDLIGFLNFTDNDIYYRKNKVSKSFFRFSFYDSSAVTEQKLLYYSTVFLDSTELFCKFLKQSSFIQDSLGEDIVYNKINMNNSECKNENVKVVFCENNDVGCRLDTTVLLTNEYDRNRSADGFNMYLFPDEVPIGNEEKTIYMKVEFNHAGNGKTIPMIVLPTGGVALTIENFLEYLFIPVKIKKQNGIYTYTITKSIDCDNGNVDLCLFEPKLEK